MLAYSFPLCGYQTKEQYTLKTRKIHSPQNDIKTKKEEYKIEGWLRNNNIHFKREHTISCTCDKDIHNSYARVDFVVEHKNNNGTFGIIFLEVDIHQHESFVLFLLVLSDIIHTFF